MGRKDRRSTLVRDTPKGTSSGNGSESRNRINIERTGRFIIIKPFPSFLDGYLTFQYTPAEYEKGDLNIKEKTYKLCKPDPRDPSQYLVPAGLTHRICRVLEERGYQISYEDSRNLNLEKPDPSQLSDKPYRCQIEALSCVFSSSGGQIVMATAAGKTHLITELCRVFPNTTTVVTSHKTPPLEAVYQNLKSEIPSQVGSLGVVGGKPETARITICHIRSLLKAPIDRCKLLYYDEVHGAAAPQRSEYLAKVSFANMYGFTASPEGRLDQAEFIIEGLFGPQLYELSHKKAVDKGLVSPINVEMWPLEGSPILDDKYHDRMKKGIVRNSARNEGIARILRDYYNDQKVVVIAQDDLEHVFRLKQLLPEYSAAYGHMTAWKEAQLIRQGLIPRDYEPLKPGGHHVLADRFREGKITKVIATSVWDTGIDLPELDVLVRAEGGPGLIKAIQLPGRVARYKKEGGIVVDFYDKFGPIFKRRSRNRINKYEDIGYNIWWRRSVR